MNRTHTHTQPPSHPATQPPSHPATHPPTHPAAEKPSTMRRWRQLGHLVLPPPGRFKLGQVKKYSDWTISPVGPYPTPFLGFLLFYLTDPNHKTRYPKTGVGYKPWFRSLCTHTYIDIYIEIYSHNMYTYHMLC